MQGNALKTISKTDTELRVGNYMVLFGGRDLHGFVPGTKQLDKRKQNRDGSRGEYFTENTKFESEYTKTGVLYMDWDHGLAPRLYGNDVDAPGRDDVLGYVDWKTAKIDKKGLWAERVINLRNEYVQWVEALIDEGLVGTSTEPVQNTVKILDNGEIAVWELKRDALTVIPEEPRMMSDNALTALKALAEFQPQLKALLQGAESTAADATDEGKEQRKHSITILEGKMNEASPELIAQIKAALQEDMAPVPDPVTKEDPAMKAMSEKLNALTDLISNSPILKDAGYVAPDSETDHDNSKSFGDYLVAVRNGNTKRIESVYKAALAEQTGPTGGYLVPPDYSNPIMARVADFSVLRRAGATIVPMSGKTREIPTLDIETAPSAGNTAYAGGVIAYRTAEAAVATESEPAFRMVELTARKLMAYSLASSEVRNDAVESIDGLFVTLFGRAIGAKENYEFFQGDGVGKPLGILNSGALNSMTRHTTLCVALTDLAVMMSGFFPESWGTGAWFANPSVLDQLIQLVSTPLSWLDNLRAGLPVMNLLGMPLYITGALPALGTVGDFMLIDPTYYLIGERQGIEIAISEHYRFAYDQLAWRVTARNDGQPWLANKVTLENGSTTVSPFVSLTTV